MNYIPPHLNRIFIYLFICPPQLKMEVPSEFSEAGALLLYVQVYELL